MSHSCSSTLSRRSTTLLRFSFNLTNPLPRTLSAGVPYQGASTTSGNSRASLRSCSHFMGPKYRRCSYRSGPGDCLGPYSGGQPRGSVVVAVVLTASGGARASEARGAVGIAGAVVLRPGQPLADRAGAPPGRGILIGGDETRRRLAALDPGVQGGQRIPGGEEPPARCTWAPEDVSQTRDCVVAHELAHLARAHVADEPDVVLRRRLGRDQSVGEAVHEEQLAASLLERGQVGLVRVLQAEQIRDPVLVLARPLRIERERVEPGVAGHEVLHPLIPEHREVGHRLVRAA